MNIFVIFILKTSTQFIKTTNKIQYTVNSFYIIYMKYIMSKLKIFVLKNFDNKK